MSNNINDYNFFLPPELIAQFPSEVRNESKLLVKDNKKTSIALFKDLFSYLPKNTVFVFNNTKVVQARLIIGKSEIFFLNKTSNNSFIALCRPGKKFKLNRTFELYGYQFSVNKIFIDGRREFSIDNLDISLEDFFDKFGNTPLPPYIKTDNPNNYKDRYQTVYSKSAGSVAAPTAGLHFTDDMIDNIKKNYKYVNVTLHVSLGTFKPIDVDDLNEHKMHSEVLEYNQETLDKLNEYKEENFFFVAVGTTSLRFLQSLYNPKLNRFEPKLSETSIFIKPGFNDFSVDALITNFHLPMSSLFVLVSAFMGLETMQDVYQTAIKNKFKFYSFGDSSLLIRNSGS